MNNIIKIGCPICGAVLSVINVPGIETKNATCPVCKNKAPFTSFRTIVEKDECTQYSQKIESDKEEITTELNSIIGQLIVCSTNKVFQLQLGENIIGREASASSATIQIPCNADQKRMSREHLKIDVKKVSGKGILHYVSLYKEQINATFIGENRIEYGDKIVLKNGDLIKLPDVDLRFMIQDNEETNIYNEI